MWGKDKKKKGKKENHQVDQAMDNKPTEPDVILDIPDLKVDEVTVKVENLDAHVSVSARLADFVSIEVGADVHVSQVKIEIGGVRAEAYLKVRLERVKTILNRTIQTLDNNPDLLKSLLKPIAEGAGSSVGSIGEGVGEVTGQLGQSVKGIVTKTGDVLSNLKLGAGIQRMLKNVNIL